MRVLRQEGWQVVADQLSIGKETGSKVIAQCKPELYGKFKK